MTTTTQHRCKDLVERNGYYTGRKCRTNAKFTITYERSGEVVHVCGTHKNKRVRQANTWSPHTVEEIK